MHTRGQNLGASPTFIVHRKKASQRVSKTCVFKDVFIYFSLGLMLTMNQNTLSFSHLKTVSKDFTHRVTFYNWIHFEIIFHPTPDGNLQEEKPLNSGVKTKRSFWPQPSLCVHFEGCSNFSPLFFPSLLHRDTDRGTCQRGTLAHSTTIQNSSNFLQSKSTKVCASLESLPCLLQPVILDEAHLSVVDTD